MQQPAYKKKKKREKKKRADQYRFIHVGHSNVSRTAKDTLTPSRLTSFAVYKPQINYQDFLLRLRGVRCKRTNPMLVCC